MSDSVTIVDGPFANFSGTIVRESGDSIVVLLSIFGRSTEVTVTRAQLNTTPLTLDTMEAEIVEAVARRGFRQRLFGFWEDEAVRTPQRSPEELARLCLNFESEVLREQEAAQQEALLAFRTAFQPLSSDERFKKWQQERETWTSWRTEARALSDARETARFPGFDEAARRAEVRRIADAAHALRSSVEAWHRKNALTMPAVSEPRNPELEAAIDRDVDSDGPFLVYADWLLSQGNRRGELITLAGKAQEKTLRDRLGQQLLGGLSAFEDRLDAKWRLGFLETIKLEAKRDDERDGINVGQLLDAALKLASTRFLRDLTIACPSVHEEQMVPRLTAALTSWGVHPSMRSLSFETNEEEEMLSWTSAGVLDGYAQLFPNLQSLHVHAGDFSFTQPRFPKLKSLVVQTCQMSLGSLQPIIDADWPELERLELWFGSRTYGVDITLEQLLPLLHSPRLPKLRSLALCNGEFTDALCSAVLESPLLPQLRSLTLSMSTMTGVGANALIAGAEKLKHLEVLDVDDNYLSDTELAALQRAVPVTRGDEHREAEEYEGELHRYASVGE